MKPDLKDKIEYLKNYPDKVNIMEVCGTHTVAISKFGIRNILSENINLISGPGCPVCVTPDIYLDYIYEISLKKDIIIASYGDMIRVPGSETWFSLEKAKAQGADVRVVYSSVDVLTLAEKNPEKKVVFLGIGFETTAPASAILLKEIINKKFQNVFILSLHKLVEPVMRGLLEDKELDIDGFLCPGHVALVLGAKGFDFLKEYDCTGVVAGFGMEEIIDGLYELLKNIKDGNHNITNSYQKVVTTDGNTTALKLIYDVYEEKDDYWRGLGLIKNSGLRLRSEFAAFDIEKQYPINIKENKRNNGCQCGEVLKGKIKPNECKLFKKVCNPENPVGPCMVSSEGSCAAYYKYSV